MAVFESSTQYRDTPRCKCVPTKTNGHVSRTSVQTMGAVIVIGVGAQASA